MDEPLVRLDHAEEQEHRTGAANANAGAGFLAAELRTSQDAKITARNHIESGGRDPELRARQFRQPRRMHHYGIHGSVETQGLALPE